MNSKQKICAIAAGVMAVSSVMPAGVLGADYSKELQEAYKWAYENGVTTMNTIDQANMYGNLTRIAMAKMLANYAINNLGKKPNSSIDCTFRDVTSAMDKAYDNGVTNACQLGIMWRAQGEVQGNFNPNDTVTRAQFGTALSRLLWGDKNNTTKAEEESGVQYYKYHLSALNKAYNGVTIMKDISNPSQNEIRGYVMLMLQRSAGMVGKSTEECTATQQLLCLLEGNCTSACEEAMKDIDNGSDEETSDDNEEKEVKSGKLTVKAEKDVDTKDIPQGWTVIVDSINLSSSEEVTVNSITLKLSDYTKGSSIDEVWFEKNGQVISNEKSSFYDNEVILSFKKGFTVKKNETIDLVVKSKADTNAVIWFIISDVKSSAESAKISQANTTICKTIAYDVTTIRFSNNGSANTTYNKDDDLHEFGKFKIEGGSDRNDKTVNLSSITFELSGGVNGEVDHLTDYEIQDIDGKKVSTEYSISKDSVTISFNDQIPAQKNKTYYLMAKVDEVTSTEESYTFVLDEWKDLIAYEEGTQARAQVTWDSKDAVLGKIVIKGGDLTLKSTQTVSSVQASWEDTDVVIAEGTITAIEPITVRKDGTDNGYTLQINGDFTTGNVKRIKVEIWGYTYDADIVEKGIAKVKDDINIEKGTSKVKVYIDLPVGKTTETIKFEDITATSFSSAGRYEENSEKKIENLTNELVGNIKMANINVTKGNAIAVKTSTTTLKVNQNKSNGRVLEGSIKNEGINDVKIETIHLTMTSSFTGNIISGGEFTGDYTGSNTLNDAAKNDVVALSISVADKSTRADDRKINIIKAWNGEKRTFTPNSNITVPAGSSVDFYLDIDSLSLNKVYSGTDSNVKTWEVDYLDKLSFVITFSWSNAKTSAEASIDGEIEGEVQNVPISVEKASSTNKSEILLHKTSNITLGTAEIEVKNGDAQLSNIELALSGVASDSGNSILSNIMVEFDRVNGTTKTFSLKKDSGTKYSASSLSYNIPEWYHNVTVKASLWDIETSTGVVQISGLTLTFDEDIAAITTFAKKDIYPARVIISRESQTNSELVLKVRNDSEETIAITGVVLSTTGAKVYVDNVLYTGTSTTFNAENTDNVVTISAGKTIEIKVQEVAAKHDAIYVKEIKYQINKDGASELSATDQNFTELGWNTFYAI